MSSSSFTPAPGELALVSQIFAQADPKKLGIITGDVAVTVFAGANLSPLVLGEIWTIADEDNKGWLAKKGVAIAVRLMGWAQAGEKITPALVRKPGPIPIIEGITAVVAKQNTGLSLPKSPPPGLPPLTAQDKLKFQRLFANHGPVNGLLSGEKARDIFVKSQLPVDKLSRIWSLADTQDRGTLDCTDFVIGLYLIQACMSGHLSFIPNSLPPGLYEQAGGGGSNTASTIISHSTGTSGSFSPIVNSAFSQTRGPIQPHYTGKTQPPPPPQQSTTASRFLSRPGFPSPSPFASPNSFSQAWDVTAAEKANSDRYFDTLDVQKKGYIDGDAAVPFMLDSKLSGDDLAIIWDLSDLNKDSRLTRDGFAVAMHLIHAKLAGKELPATLPPSLRPPSMRSDGSSVIQNTHEQEGDLFSWDTSPTTPPPAPPQKKKSYPQPSAALPAPFSPLNDPFGSSNFSASQPRKDNLLDDEDNLASSHPLQDQSAEIGNLQNQVNSTLRSLDSAKTERASVEQTLANQATQVSSLQTQLSSAKAAYETETRLLATLRERWTAQTAEIQKATEELIRAESDLSAVRVEKAEVEGSFLRDKEDARELHRKMIEASQLADAMKLEMEKVKKEAKQQKGLLAIAKKQLSTKEAEKAKAEKDLEKAQAELVAVTKVKEEMEMELERDSLQQQAAPVGEEVGASAQHIYRSPSPSSVHSSGVGKSNNPFDRLMSSAKSSPRSPSVYLPFSNPPPLPTAAAAAAEPEVLATVDPFGFSQAFEQPVASDKEPIDHSGAESDKGTPRVPPVDVSVLSPTSIDTDTSDNEYATPLTASKTMSRGASPAVPSHVESNPAMFTSDLNGAAAAPQFPSVEVDFASRFPAAEGASGDVHELGKVVEVEDDSSDTDSDSIPLAELVKDRNPHGPGIVPPTNGAKAVVPGFDDIFPTWAPQAASAPPAEQPPPTPISKDAFGVPIVPSSNQPFVPPPAKDVPPKAGEPASVVSGINAFDEAMGKISGNGPSVSAPQFTFDSAFEDNFDFASAAGAKFPPAANDAVNGSDTPNVPATSQKADILDNLFTPQVQNDARGQTPRTSSDDAPVPLSFDAAFPTAPAVATTTTNGQLPLSQTPANPPPPTTTSFDDMFAGFESPIAITTDSLSGPSSSYKPPPGPPPPGPSEPTTNANTNTNTKLFPAVSPPSSPNTGPPQRTSSVPPSSPPAPAPRQKSPPPSRVTPPKASRPSTASSSHEKPKDPPPRHSKLSLRLPFGRKKKHQESLPPPPPAPQQDESSEPALDDDVDSVKQLCGMGFTRTQVVASLESHGYDMQKALNNLLGQ